MPQWQGARWRGGGISWPPADHTQPRNSTEVPSLNLSGEQPTPSAAERVPPGVGLPKGILRGLWSRAERKPVYMTPGAAVGWLGEFRSHLHRLCAVVETFRKPTAAQ